MITVFLLLLPFYILTNPLTAFAEMMNDNDLAVLSDFQAEHGYYGDDAIIDISGEYIENDIPLFIQWDKRWNLYPYGNSTIGKGGCGPTSLAMVVVGLTGDITVNPKTLCDYSVRNGYRVDGVGTAWGLMTTGARDFGLVSEEISRTKNNIATALRAGKPIIASMSKGHFTRAGHFIVLVGIRDDGKILVNDSNSPERSQMAWDIQIIINESRGMWSYYAS